ncbi:MAG: D-glycero-beta-D-manno-heptose 1-phosphate adenylyltransferase [Proteobacteria bacterium]|nr:D-glycero-beta-D-manno-heptose 1-phosphate adenylyltransferase [Pseudomonadota bacterium]
MEKILTQKELPSEITRLKRAGKKIVFTNGCFDILHAGHVRYLVAAKQEGDILVLGLNSDKSVKSIKGEKRPIVSQMLRAEVLAGLLCVDFITFFDEPDPLNLIKAVSPDVLVKGDDWAEENIIGADFVKANGGKVVRVSMVPGISTSSIIKKILEVYEEKMVDG